VETCNIFSDSQAAIKALRNPRKQSGQSIINDILDEIDRLLLTGINLTIRWIPGHLDIEGNEKADEAAKKAAQNPTINGNPAWDTWTRKYAHYPLKSAQKGKVNALAKVKWKDQWMAETGTANPLRHLSKYSKFQTGIKYYRSAPTRKSATLLAQMRTGHCGLNLYLNRFKKVPSPFCECRYQKETVEHYLLECRRFKEERNVILRRIVGSTKMKMRILLGESKYIKHVAKYVEETKRFG
jgi:hypothetical protein